MSPGWKILLAIGAWLFCFLVVISLECGYIQIGIDFDLKQPECLWEIYPLGYRGMNLPVNVVAA